MRTPDEVARAADQLVPWRRVWAIVGVALALVALGTACTALLFGRLLAPFKELGDWLRSLAG